MWYVISALIILFGLLIVGRILTRLSLSDLSDIDEGDAIRLPSLLTPPIPQNPLPPASYPRAEPVALRPAPGAPNIDPPTDRHVTARGTATITKRTGRRTSTGQR